MALRLMASAPGKFWYPPNSPPPLAICWTAPTTANWKSHKKGRGSAFHGLEKPCEPNGLLRKPVVFVIHRDVVLPLFRNVVFRENRGNGASRFAGATVDAFCWVNIQHRRGLELSLIFFGVDAIHRARV